MMLERWGRNSERTEKIKAFVERFQMWLRAVAVEAEKALLKAAEQLAKLLPESLQKRLLQAIGAKTNQAVESAFGEVMGGNRPSAKQPEKPS